MRIGSRLAWLLSCRGKWWVNQSEKLPIGLTVDFPLSAFNFSYGHHKGTPIWATCEMCDWESCRPHTDSPVVVEIVAVDACKGYFGLPWRHCPGKPCATHENPRCKTHNNSLLLSMWAPCGTNLEILLGYGGRTDGQSQSMYHILWRLDDIALTFI